MYHIKTSLRFTIPVILSATGAYAASVGLCNTGVKVNCVSLATPADTTPDTFWSVSTVSTTPVTTASLGSLAFSDAFVNPPNPGWIGPDGISQWISPKVGPLGDQAYVGGYYVYQDSFLTPSSSTITGRWSSDNEGIAVFLNGVQLSLALPGPSDNSSTWTAFSITGFQAGLNVLDFEVRNRGGQGIDANPTDTGIRVEFAGVNSPEPGTLVLIGAGLSAIGLAGNRRRRQRITRAALCPCE